MPPRSSEKDPRALRIDEKEIAQAKAQAATAAASHDLCLSLVVPQDPMEIADGTGSTTAFLAPAAMPATYRTLDLEFQSILARDAALRFFRGQVRLNRIKAEATAAAATAENVAVSNNSSPPVVATLAATMVTTTATSMPLMAGTATNISSQTSRRRSTRL